MGIYGQYQVCAFFFLLCLHISSASKWTSANCNAGGTAAVVGYVTDAVCCSNYTTSCTDLTSTQCDGENRCLWKDGGCKLNRDSANNVCCPGEPNPICDSLAKGLCPSMWQVSHACCQDHKYDGILATQNDATHVCCNAPCTAIEAAFAGGDGRDPQPQCTIEIENKPHCLEARHGLFGGRSGLLGGRGGFGAGNVFAAGDIQALLGLPATGPMGMGDIVNGFGNMGLPGALGAAAIKQVGDAQSKHHHVEEITVDDLMKSLIMALDTDKEVFDYEREITSDPWFKKQGFGGMKSGFAFIDPWMFLDQIYGSPFGLSQAQMKYGQMYGLPASSFKSAKFGGMGGLGGMGGMNGMGMGGMGGMMGMGGMSGMMGGMGGLMGGMGAMMGGMHGMGGMGHHGMMGGMGQHGMMGGMGHNAMGGMGHHHGGMGHHHGPPGHSPYGNPSLSSYAGYPQYPGQQHQHHTGQYSGGYYGQHGYSQSGRGQRPSS